MSILSDLKKKVLDGKILNKEEVNAAISGYMLTAAGIETKDDIELVKSLGFEV